MDEKVEEVMGKWQKGQEVEEVEGDEERTFRDEDVSKGRGEKEETVNGVQLH